MHRFGAMLIAVGAAVALAAGIGLVIAASAYSDCTDECHGGLFVGGGAIVLVVIGLGVVLAGAAVISQHRPLERVDVSDEPRG